MRCGLETDHAYAFGLRNGECHVGLLAGSDADGFTVLMFNWLGGFFDRELWVAWDLLATYCVGYELSPSAMRKRGLADDHEQVWDMDPLGTFQERYEKRHGVVQKVGADDS